MGMVFAGMAEGMGNGITAMARSAQEINAAYERSQQLKEVTDMKNQAAMTASDNRLKGVEDRISALAAGGGGGKGAGDPDILPPEVARQLAALDLKVGGDTVAKLDAFSKSGTLPTIDQQYQTAIQEKSAFDADPSSQGAGPNGATVDYSDATTRRMQQDTTTGGEMATRQIVDPTFMDLYQQKSQDFSNSLRKSYQPKEYKSLAEGDSEKQKQGLVNSYMNGGPNAARAGQALTLDNGDPVYNNSGVNTVDGSGSSYSKSQENVNNAQAADFRVKATQAQSGESAPVAVPPKPTASAAALAAVSTAPVSAPKLSQAQVTKALADAKDAISKGYQRDAVINRLKQNGITPPNGF
ncbi:hypothetical protein [Undibacterium sp.]|uniref:hypothetical protein n=1 Tax=Undibacterium sp. TaxID=1914977 RepID=UPI00374C9538